MYYDNLGADFRRRHGKTASNLFRQGSKSLSRRKKIARNAKHLFPDMSAYSTTKKDWMPFYTSAIGGRVESDLKGRKRELYPGLMGVWRGSVYNKSMGLSSHHGTTTDNATYPNNHLQRCTDKSSNINRKFRVPYIRNLRRGNGRHASKAVQESCPQLYLGFHEHNVRQ